jgi:hypothetical protein
MTPGGPARRRGMTTRRAWRGEGQRRWPTLRSRTITEAGIRTGSPREHLPEQSDKPRRQNLRP